ncbi:hypothetical protein IQ255_11015 [Pleurocapsales cyanobacterium LEGE 10410]|nr:hypothetical protein [Pleurocapsales cyanobacterium LEGE 10410]
MSGKTKSVRPKNLSRWVFFGEKNDSNVSWSIGGDLSYINLVRSNHRPIIFIRREVCIDLVEGFSDRTICLFLNSPTVSVCRLYAI